MYVSLRRGTVLRPSMSLNVPKWYILLRMVNTCAGSRGRSPEGSYHVLVCFAQDEKIAHSDFYFMMKIESHHDASREPLYPNSQRERYHRRFLHGHDFCCETVKSQKSVLQKRQSLLGQSFIYFSMFCAAGRGPE